MIRDPRQLYIEWILEPIQWKMSPPVLGKLKPRGLNLYENITRDKIAIVTTFFPQFCCLTGKFVLSENFQIFKLYLKQLSFFQQWFQRLFNTFSLIGLHFPGLVQITITMFQHHVSIFRQTKYINMYNVCVFSAWSICPLANIHGFKELSHEIKHEMVEKSVLGKTRQRIGV